MRTPAALNLFDRPEIIPSQTEEHIQAAARSVLRQSLIREVGWRFEEPGGAGEDPDPARGANPRKSDQP